MKSDQLSLARTITVVDSATLSDANIPPAQAIDCYGFDTIWVGAEFTGGAGPTVTIEALVRDADAPDQKRWKRLIFQGASPGVTAVAAAVPSTTTALDGTSLHEIRVDGRKQVFLRATALTGAPTSVDILFTGAYRRLVQNNQE